ncbi:hypothetical protein NMY22_g12606 [Coprinellus aureogranulatus]|nr:hypothetical protein NMY22_g12606 [Coprinellus aureogranulatus]
MPSNTIPIRRRIRGGISVMEDSDSSDGEIDIEVSAVLNTETGRVTQTHLEFSATPESLHMLPPLSSLSNDNMMPLAKALLSSETRSASADDSTPEEMPCSANHSTEDDTNPPRPAESNPDKRQYQGASEKMKMFIENIEPLQDAVSLARPIHTREELASAVPRMEWTIGASRARNLHFLWDSGFFRPVSLKDLGLHLYLGHCGARCPNLSSTSSARPLVLVDTNGFHHVALHFCKCDGAPEEFIQLMRARLFPATVIQPSTAFSFDVLENFHNHTLTSKKSVYDYHDALTRLTNAAFPKDIPNRYPELCRVSRVWRYLALLRRSGQSHGIDDFLKNRRLRSVVIRCPACPEVGFNIDKAEIELVAEDEKHRYTLFISADGNFRLQRKAKNDDPDDVSLNEGHGYFANMEGLNGVSDDDDAAVCAHLRAVRLQNIVKFRNAVISGVISIQCARHGFHLPQGMVDLIKGESYPRTDYALNSSLEDQLGQRWIMMSYDIWCSYSVNLQKRFRETFPESAELIEKMRGAVPKMHIKNHIVACQQLWAFNYLRHSGETCGELIETSWADLNQASGSTKEMNDGNRHDTIEDFVQFRNFRKSQAIAEDTAEHYTETLSNLAVRTDAFNRFNSRFDAKLIEQWSAMKEPYKDSKGKVHSPYEAKITAVPTRESAYQKLVDEEKVNRLARQEDMGDSALINTGIDLEEERIRLAAASENDAYSARSLSSERRLYHAQATEWLERYTVIYPQIQTYTEALDEECPETSTLPLPSTLNEPTRASLGLTALANAELLIRKGQAHDALADIRIAIKSYNFNLKWKKDHVFGQGPNTKAQRYLDELVNDRTEAVKRYERIRNALLSLGLDPTDPTLRPISAKDDNPKMTKNMALPSQLGDTKKSDPWFWTAVSPDGLSKKEEAEWSLEMDRVKWFRDRAARDRAREEKEILEEEMKRIVRSFKNYTTIWTSLASEDRPGITSTPGKASYALRQAEMYARFAYNAEQVFDKALNPPPPKVRKKRTNASGKASTMRS